MKHRHNLSNYRLLTGELGKLYPAGLIEVLPGDVMRGSSSLMVRLSPMAAPVMHNMTIRVHHFFVPHRLAWPSDTTGTSDTFESFITGGPDGRDNNALPTVTTNGVEKGLFDYMGLPNVSGIEVNSMPIKAYNLVWNEWFRDQDLQPARDEHQNDIARIAWAKDYFTTARPWPQKGDEVSLPLGTVAPVKGIGANLDTTYSGPETEYNETGGNTVTYDTSSQIDQTTGNRFGVQEDPNNPGFPGIYADLSQATAATINALRRASGLQRFMEARSRYGSRYAEYVRHAFGARPLDARLQRPELLASGSQQVGISEVIQTANEQGTQRFGVGDMYGHGIGLTRSNRFRTRFSEHGYVLSLVSVRPKSLYTNGIDRTWLRQFREDFYQRELAHIGQQQVKQQEVYASATNAEEVFGWSDRYAEYRNTLSRVVGEFRTTLDYWHLGRIFQDDPALNAAFVTCHPTKRIFNVTDTDTDSLWMLNSNRVQALRVVPRNATARLL